MRRVLSSSFFNRPTLIAAKELLGKFLVRKNGSEIIEGTITDVEAYAGSEDRASHASRGKTPRTEVMFGKPGRWYVYMIYGMYYCVNIVTEEEEYPAAILIRSVMPERSCTYQRSPVSADRGKMKIIGPGKVCRHFQIDTSFNRCLADKKTGLWIEDRGVTVDPRKILRGKRIGVDYAGEWKEKLWRFYLL